MDESVSARRGEEGLFREIKVCRGSGIVLDEEKELNSKNFCWRKGKGGVSVWLWIRGTNLFLNRRFSLYNDFFMYCEIFEYTRREKYCDLISLFFFEIIAHTY